MAPHISSAVLALALAVVTAGAQTVGGVTLAGTVKVGDQTLVLNGAAVRSKFVVDVYVGALYLPAKQSSAEAILGGDTPRQMSMHFLRDVEAGQLAGAWQEGLAANTPNASAEVRSAFETLASWMENVAKGDELVLTYVPGGGTTVQVKGQTKGTLGGGKPVADALLATWIGPKPGPGKGFKTGVLGQCATSQDRSRSR
jgi:hypothetical protein